ncbi:unnamed protein product [Dicrocoelium dendriticum]|nr:unnamed protein product [Dicrocoelium dendriticum]
MLRICFLIVMTINFSTFHAWLPPYQQANLACSNLCRATERNEPLRLGQRVTRNPNSAQLRIQCLVDCIHGWRGKVVFG